MPKSSKRKKSENGKPILGYYDPETREIAVYNPHADGHELEFEDKNPPKHVVKILEKYPDRIPQSHIDSCGKVKKRRKIRG